MNLNPLPLTKVDNLKGLFEEAISELKLTERSNVDFLLQRLKVGYAQRSIDAYVDDIDAPKHALVLEKSHGGVTKEQLLEVRFVFSTESDRGNPDAQQAFTEQIGRYAEIFGCDAILASSWVYQGARPIDAFWVGQGFEKQEVVYVKRLKPNS